MPVTDLTPVAGDDTAGTLVHFQPDDGLVADLPPLSDLAWKVIEEFMPRLSVELAPAQ